MKKFIDPFCVAKNWIEYRKKNDYHPTHRIQVKVCSCGKQFIGTPDWSRYHTDPEGLTSGFYFECNACNSTCFIPDESAA